MSAKFIPAQENVNLNWLDVKTFIMGMHKRLLTSNVRGAFDNKDFLERDVPEYVIAVTGKGEHWQK